jgi:hypothetical protein
VLPTKASAVLQPCMRLLSAAESLGNCLAALGACAAMQNCKTVHSSRTTGWQCNQCRNLCLAVCRICRSRGKLCDSKRYDSTESDHSESVTDFPPDIAGRRSNATTTSRVDDFTVKSKFYAFMESRLVLSAGHGPPG